MLEPTLSLIAMPREQPCRFVARAVDRDRRWSSWIAAAPFMSAALWATAMGAAFLVWAITGDRAPLDWLRSGSGLIASAAVIAAALLVASLTERLPARRPAPKRRVAPAIETRSFSGWHLDEGRFDSA